MLKQCRTLLAMHRAVYGSESKCFRLCVSVTDDGAEVTLLDMCSSEDKPVGVEELPKIVADAKTRAAEKAADFRCKALALESAVRATEAP